MGVKSLPERLRFGPAGKPIDFKGDMVKVPEYLHSIGLDALEYEAVRGVRISETKARLLGEEAKKYDVVLSLHAPYYINLASPERKTIENSIKRLIDAVQAAYWMSAYVVVFHVGYYKGNESKKAALEKSINALREVVEEMKNRNIKGVWLGPETTGKRTQIGSVEEVIEICYSIDMCRPVIDWAHIHARALGMRITKVNEVIKIIEMIEKELGSQVLNPLHMHFSKIEYGSGGEKEHHVLDKEEFGPDFRIVCRGLKEVGIKGVIISESPVLDKDALIMKHICCGEMNYC